MIPPLIVLKAAEDRYVLVSLTMTNGCMEAILVDNSKYLFTNAEWRSDGIEGQPEDCKFRRISSRSEPKIYSTTLYKTSHYMIVPWNQPIPIYTMKYSGVILPSTYFKVFKGEDTEEKWHFKKHAIAPPRPSAPFIQPAPVKIPTHIVRGFIESAIQKKEVCPITLETLVMGNVAMTSCGHLFERQAIVNSLASSNTCPNCRADVNQDGLVNL
jgi:hypothetical protein